MPPRYAYWTILIDGKPTAFRAAKQDELLPTLAQLRRTNPVIEMKWFARGKLWDSPEQAQWAGRNAHNLRKAGPPRDREWRPGGEHKDPRARFDKHKKQHKPRTDRPRERDRDRPPATTKPDAVDPPRSSESTRRPEGKRPWSGDKRGDRPFTSTPPRGDRPWQNKSGPPRGDRPWSGKPPGADRAWRDKAASPPRGDRPWSGKPGAPKGDRPWRDKPAGGPPRADRPWSGKPSASAKLRRDESGGDLPGPSRPRDDGHSGPKDGSGHAPARRPRGGRPFPPKRGGGR